MNAKQKVAFMATLLGAGALPAVAQAQSVPGTVVTVVPRPTYGVTPIWFNTFFQNILHVLNVDN